MIELRCTYDPATTRRQRARRPQGQGDHALAVGGAVAAGRNPHLQPLFAKPTPDAANFAADLNPQSLEILTDARIEPAIAAEPIRPRSMQFERQGYFVRDTDSTPDHPVFNRTIGLRDTFAKEVGGKG